VTVKPVMQSKRSWKSASNSSRSRLLEELFWKLEDEASELAKTAKFVTGLLPALNRKLCGKEYTSFQLEFKAAQIE